MVEDGIEQGEAPVSRPDSCAKEEALYKGLRSAQANARLCSGPWCLSAVTRRLKQRVRAFGVCVQDLLSLCVDH